MSAPESIPATVTQRDPRVDPQPGDVTRFDDRQSRCAVWANDGSIVNFFLVSRDGTVTPDFLSLAEWRHEARTDTVHAVSGRPVDADAFPAAVLA